MPLTLCSGVLAGVQAMYIATGREAKRLESIAQSPIFSTLGEYLQAHSPGSVLHVVQPTALWCLLHRLAEVAMACNLKAPASACYTQLQGAELSTLQLRGMRMQHPGDGRLLQHLHARAARGARAA